MNKYRLFLVAVATMMMIMAPAAAMANGSTEKDEPAEMPPPMMAMSETMEGVETAVFAGGCFWGVEAVFEALAGVTQVRSGYSGGEASTANYSQVSSGATEHAESVEIVYDPSVISYGTLLEVFFTVAHDPTQLNYQGPDQGSQYRSAIFYANDNQRAVAESSIEEIDASGIYSDSIVTQVVPLQRFFPAEEYHQDFVERNPNQGYVAYWDIPKLEHLAEAYPDLLAPK